MLTAKRAIAGLTILVLVTACAREAPELSQADQDAVKAHIEKYRQAVLAADWVHGEPRLRPTSPCRRRTFRR